MTQTAEVSAGGGYQSQSTATLTFGLPEGETLRKIAVVWPDGSESTRRGTDNAVVVVSGKRSREQGDQRRSKCELDLRTE